MKQIHTGFDHQGVCRPTLEASPRVVQVDKPLPMEPGQSKPAMWVSPY